MKMATIRLQRLMRFMDISKHITLIASDIRTYPCLLKLAQELKRFRNGWDTQISIQPWIFMRI